MRTQQGFTLIELLVVVAIIGLLSAIALPSYTDYVTRSQFPDATSGLASKRVQMEQYFQDNRTYIGAPACANDAVASPFFTFACATAPAVTANTYQLEAIGINSMAGFAFTINETAARTAVVSGAALTAGWAGNNTCWISKRGGAC